MEWSRLAKGTWLNFAGNLGLLRWVNEHNICSMCWSMYSGTVIQKHWGWPFTKALYSIMQIVKLLQTWLIETEDYQSNVGVMIWLCQGGLHSVHIFPLSVSSQLHRGLRDGKHDELCHGVCHSVLQRHRHHERSQYVRYNKTLHKELCYPRGW